MGEVSMFIETDNRMAPRPPRACYTRSIYDALRTLSGPSTMDQIKMLLPATDDAAMWKARITRKEMRTRLYSAVRFGYAVHNKGNDTWSMASYDYWLKRQAARTEEQRRWRSRVEKGVVGGPVTEGPLAAKRAAKMERERERAKVRLPAVKAEILPALNEEPKAWKFDSLSGLIGAGGALLWAGITALLAVLL